MRPNLQAEGAKLIYEAEQVLRREVQSALNEGDYNMVVRRSQEAVELTLKGALKILGVDYPKVHDVAPVFSEQVKQKRSTVDIKTLERIEEISLWLSQARTPSFYFERDYGDEDARQAFEDAKFAFAEVKKILDITG